jgi:HSP20 family protein
MPFLGTFAVNSPFSLMRRMMEDLDRMFEEFGSPRSAGGGASLQRTRDDLSRGGLAGVDWVPAIEAFERDGQFVVRAELPGLTKDDVRIQITDDGLLIEGERRQGMEAEEEGGIYRSERVYGRFSRYLNLPDRVDPDKAQARFDNGVLEITIAMTDQGARGRRIEIQGQGTSPGGQQQPEKNPPVH